MVRSLLYRGVCSLKQTNENEFKILKYRFLHCISTYLPCSIRSVLTELRAPHFRLFWNIKQYVLSLGTWLANQVPDVISKCAWFPLSENSPQLGRTFACFCRKIRFLFRHKKYVLFQAVFCFLWVNIFFDWGEILPAFAKKYVFFSGTKNTFSFRLSLARGFGFIWVNIFFNWVEVLTASAENSFSFQAQTIRSLSGFLLQEWKKFVLFSGHWLQLQKQYVLFSGHWLDPVLNCASDFNWEEVKGCQDGSSKHNAAKEKED